MSYKSELRRVTLLRDSQAAAADYQAYLYWCCYLDGMRDAHRGWPASTNPEPGYRDGYQFIFSCRRGRPKSGQKTVRLPALYVPETMACDIRSRAGESLPDWRREAYRAYIEGSLCSIK